MRNLASLCAFALLLVATWYSTTAEANSGYHPLHVSHLTQITHLDLSIHDNRRMRDIPVRVYLPQSVAAQPLILFSPGLGGSRTGYAYLARHWALRGYVVVVLQHPGSDDSLWRGKSKAAAIAALRNAASGQNFLQRIRDVKVVLDRLAQWNRAGANPLAGRIDMRAIGMAGHSFGAVTSEAVSGERFRGRAMFTDPRIRAALLLSPSSPRHETPAAAFGRVTIPWMLMTGSHDIGLLGLGAQDVASRLAVYTALPGGQKYELVLAGAQHSAFSDRPLSPLDPPRNPNDHRVILALSTAFWDSVLRHRAAAQRWLDGSAPQSLLKAGDQWRWK